MRRAGGAWPALAMAGAATAACGTILGLEAPPSPDGGAVSDATAGGDDGKDAGAGPDAHPICAPLDVDSTGGTYSPLRDDAGASLWELFDTVGINGLRNGAFAGGTFDGRYVYFPGRSSGVARYDTQGVFGQASSWSAVLVSTIGVPGGFAGAVYDGRRYVYFVPYILGSPNDSVVARYDSTLPFDAASSWASFDLTGLSADAGPATIGFAGASFDGRYIYFVPHNDGVPDGRVVRYDTTPADGGVVIDAGDEGHAGVDAGDARAEGGDGGRVGATFGSPALWSTFDVSSTNPLATGFVGAVFDGKALYLVPNSNGAFDAAVHGGGSGLVARYRLDAGFTSPSAWSTFDTTTVNGLAETDWGGAFDGRYVYFAPRQQGIVTRVDTSSPQTSSIDAWSSYDLTRLLRPSGSGIGYAGAAFDGRFVYFVPTGSGFATVARYDTRSTFEADCAWSTLDLKALAMGDGGPQNFFGAVFDGQYVYLVPNTGGLFARFNARTPPSKPALPAFYGSFF
jgi:hypothetical protein